MLKNCEVCGDEFKSSPSANRRFCSQECRGVQSSYESSTVCECRICGALSQMRKSRPDRMHNCKAHPYIGFRKHKQKNCKHCGKKFNPVGRTTYCSRDCYLKDTASHVVNNCQFCGAKFTLSKSAMANVNGRGKYCSMDCLEFAYALFIKWPKGRAVKEISRVCPGCGVTFKQLETGYMKKYCTVPCATRTTYRPFHGNGENHWNWQGGIDEKARGVRHSYRYEKWRQSVFERDDHICQECGESDCELHAHHVFEFVNYPEHRLEVWNGLTLCRDCHEKIHGTQAA